MFEFLNQLWTNHSVVMLSVLYKVVLVLLTLIVAYFTNKFVHKSIHKANANSDKIDETLVPIMCTASTVTLFLIGLLVIFDIFGINTASLLTLMGAAGLAIGLALKDTLSNIAAGMVLLILRPFKVGHYIEVGSQGGTVKEISLFTTIIDTADGIYISIPNSTMWGSPLKNFTRNQKRRLDLVVGISYGDSIDEGMKVLRKLIEEEPRFLELPAPQVIVTEMADSSVNMQLRGWLTVDDFWAVKWDLTKKAKEQIEAAGLSIPFPQRDVHIHQAGQ